MQITKDEIIKALSEVYDPEIPINIVDMGLIYRVDLDSKNNVEIDMTMTTRGCPMHSMMTYAAKKRVEKIDGIGSVKVNLIWDPPWTPEMINPKIKEQMLKNNE